MYKTSTRTPRPYPTQALTQQQLPAACCCAREQDREQPGSRGAAKKKESIGNLTGRNARPHSYPPAFAHVRGRLSGDRAVGMKVCKV